MVLPKPKQKKKRLNPLTNKIARGGKGLEQRKGQKGIIPQYVTRQAALKRLQLSPLDFRRLCILKGIFPRDPSKKAFGNDKTYYHVKDLQFLAHEPLLAKYRQLKVYAKKIKKAMARSDDSRLKTLKEHKPQVTLDHLVRERYPTFIDALNDCDDALSTIFLFNTLPAKLVKQYSSDRVALNNRLCTEWLYYVIRTQSLHKVFVSIKGIYYQVRHQSNTGQITHMTWLQPHKFTQYLPDDIDYKIILIFLQHYETLLRFVFFKLYTDINVKYPPQIDHQMDNIRAGLHRIVRADAIDSNAETVDNKAVIDTSAEQTASNKLQSSVSALASNIDDAADNTDSASAAETTTKADDDSMRDFKALGGELSVEEQDTQAVKSVFKDKTFLLQRETPQESLELVILCGGGSVVFEHTGEKLTKAQQSSITHVIIDRPTISNKIDTREYIQPQWVYDSFNTRACLPVHPYTVGQIPPPHLSPFVDDASEGYIPTQAKILKKWRALANGETLSDDEADDAVDGTKVESEDDEVVYKRDLDNEKAGVTYTQLSEQQQQAIADTDNDDVESDDANDVVVDVSDNENTVTVEAPSNKRKPDVDEQPSKKSKVASDDVADYAKMMMPKKDKKLYNAMQMGIEKKQAIVDALEAKRTKLEEDRTKLSKNGRPKRKQYKKGDKAKLAKSKG